MPHCFGHDFSARDTATEHQAPSMGACYNRLTSKDHRKSFTMNGLYMMELDENAPMGSPLVEASNSNDDLEITLHTLNRSACGFGAHPLVHHHGHISLHRPLDVAMARPHYRVTSGYHIPSIGSSLLCLSPLVARS
jgi:hypothetical protein